MQITINKILYLSNNNIHNREPFKNHNLTFQCDRTAIKTKTEEDLQARPNNIILVCKDIQTNPVFKERYSS